jgi:hypothetical protein
MSDSLLRQREFFKILDEFFRKATGKQPKEFANIDKFGEVVRAGGQRLADRAPNAFRLRCVHAQTWRFLLHRRISSGPQRVAEMLQLPKRIPVNKYDFSFRVFKSILTIWLKLQ